MKKQQNPPPPVDTKNRPKPPPAPPKNELVVQNYNKILRARVEMLKKENTQLEDKIKEVLIKHLNLIFKPGMFSPNEKQAIEDAWSRYSNDIEFHSLINSLMSAILKKT